jgi:hypothetical protein
MSAVRVDDGRPVELVQQPPTTSRRPGPRPRPGPSASEPAFEANSAIGSIARGEIFPSSSGHAQLDRLEQALLEDRQRRVGHRDGDVARVRAEGRLGGEARAPVSPREPPTTSTVPAVYLFWSGRCAGTARGSRR